ncbi:predicted protein [Uncinocarpus reesii 1704]|uniref:Carrier domain-containing protein n=1 Tax=Uncinocarpus reesii (strain UAMH 1704) TaxID=336963 RepID=C4JN12_UNCRE|nr:uncharacterized protein UREG_04220 [Uncinocarpus reesii 1704]EEP79374.1 predicted protein [Uncinocarpus reesii 1704]
MVAIISEPSEYDETLARDEGLGQLFYQRVTEAPSSIAVAAPDGQSLTYETVHNKAAEIAQALHQAGFGVEERVGILVQHSIWDAITQVAILYAGGTCVPLDPLLPDQQIQDRLERIGARHVLVDAANFARNLPSLTMVPLGEKFCNGPLTNGALQAASRYPLPTRLTHVTHLLHTSGTTSTPKAVQIAAGSILHVAYHAPFEPVRRSDVVAHSNPISFDLALFDIWVPLLSGACIQVLNRATLLDIPALADAIRQRGVTVMATTTALINLTAATCPTAFEPLRLLLTGGEAANLQAIEAIFSAGRPGRFINAYGPTECCVFCHVHEITTEDMAAGKVSIGLPIGRNVCCVCDEEGRLVPDGEEGELVVGGPGVSPGYLDQPKKNAASFITVPGMVDPMTGTPYRMYRTGDLVRRRLDGDGQYDFAGRRDHQVKVRGYRVELNAIDATLMQTGHFADTIVMRIDSSEIGAGAALVAFVVLHDPSMAGSAIEDARSTLLATLPEYMVPHIEVVPEMPLNAHNKVDRRQLEEMYRKRREQHLYTLNKDTAKMQTREHLSRFWATILATPIPQYSDDDDFFKLGGTSLQASLLISRIRKELHTDISLLTLYENSTLGSLSSVVDYSRGGSMDTVRNEQDVWVADTKVADGLKLPDGPVVDWRRDTEGRVFLTGATGFVDTFSSKILVLCGTLEDQWLGLGEERFLEVAEWASVVFHLGARVNYTQPYSLHRPANTIGTVNVVRLAIAKRLKGVQYCSSISCFGPTGRITGSKIVYEDASLAPHVEALPYDHGYSQSHHVTHIRVCLLSGPLVPSTPSTIGVN